MPSPPILLAAPLVVGLFVAGLAACDRFRAKPESQQEAPASSVITLGVTLGACDDLATCERECDAGSADRCRRLAVSYALGQTAPKNETYATSLYERACEMGDPAGCVFAGQMHEFEHGVPKDVPAAARFYEKACKLGYAAGCYNLAILNESGRGLPTDLGKAAELYAVACKAGASRACEKGKELRAMRVDSSASNLGNLP